MAVAYALLLYVGYWFFRGHEAFGSARAPLLYMGQITAVMAVVRILNEPIVELTVGGCSLSGAWGCFTAMQSRARASMFSIPRFKL